MELCQSGAGSSQLQVTFPGGSTPTSLLPSPPGPFLNPTGRQRPGSPQCGPRANSGSDGVTGKRPAQTSWEAGGVVFVLRVSSGGPVNTPGVCEACVCWGGKVAARVPTEGNARALYARAQAGAQVSGSKYRHPLSLRLQTAWKVGLMFEKTPPVEEDFLGWATHATRIGASPPVEWARLSLFWDKVHLGPCA